MKNIETEVYNQLRAAFNSKDIQNLTDLQDKGECTDDSSKANRRIVSVNLTNLLTVNF